MKDVVDNNVHHVEKERALGLLKHMKKSGLFSPSHMQEEVHKYTDRFGEEPYT